MWAVTFLYVYQSQQKNAFRNSKAWGVTNWNKTPLKRIWYIYKKNFWQQFSYCVHCVLQFVQLAVLPREQRFKWIEPHRHTQWDWGEGQQNTLQPWLGIRDEHRYSWLPSQISARVLPLLLLHCVCMWHVCNHVVGGYMGEQISFELLIWNKVAQEASRAVILFPNVHENL